MLPNVADAVFLNVTFYSCVHSMWRGSTEIIIKVLQIDSVMAYLNVSWNYFEIISAFVDVRLK